MAKVTDISNTVKGLAFSLLDEDGTLIEVLTPGKQYSEKWVWDVLRIIVKDSTTSTLVISEGDFTETIDKIWTLSLKSFGGSSSAVRIIRKVVEERMAFDAAVADELGLDS